MCLDCSVGCDPNDDQGNAAHITMAVLQAAADASGISPLEAATNILANVAMAGTMDSEVAKAAAAIDTIAVNVLKAQEEKRWTLGLAYPALKADAAVAADHHRDYIQPAVLEAAAWGWMLKHRDVGLWHAEGVSKQASVVESHIHRGDPWVMKAADGASVTIHEGDWLIACIWSEEAWPLVKSGAIRGFSPQGAAQRRVPSADDLATLRA